jgi:hypothetical protein
MINGTQNAFLFPDSAPFHSISPQKAQTLQTLLDALKSEGISGLLQTAAAKVSDCLNKPPGDITFEELAVVHSQLEVYLHDCRYKRNTIKTYLKSLLRIPGQGGHDSEIDPVSIPKLIRSRFRDEVGQGFRF